jgi:5-formyltetrahydrofolate cyclo-ligase
MYWPMPWEVDLRPLMERLRQRGVGVAIPCFDAEREVYRAALVPADTKLLCAGKQGILEPTAPEWVLNKEIDFWLVPGLAFDWNGNRLGHGGGWFDRILESARKACLCGIAYSWEMVDSVPGERHDIQMEWMATNRGVFRALRLLGGGRL